MTPRYRITAWDKDITALVADRRLSASVTDEAGIEADQFTMTLDDRDNVLAWPEKGAKLAVWLGYVESGLLKVGDYIVDEIEYSEPPATMVIRAKAADYANAYLKSQKTRSWPKNMTIGDLAKKIAAEHKLKPLVGKSVAAIKLPATHQTEESDLNLLTRRRRAVSARRGESGRQMIQRVLEAQFNALRQDLVRDTTENVRRARTHRRHQSSAHRLFTALERIRNRIEQFESSRRQHDIRKTDVVLVLVSDVSGFGEPIQR